MNADIIREEETKVKKQLDDTCNGRYIYAVFHIIMSLVATYLSFRCNKKFEMGTFLVTCLCPYFYLVYILATRGTCGIIEG